jgi:hypothetical protein
LQEGKEVGHVLRRQPLFESFGHQRFSFGAKFFDLAAQDRVVGFAGAAEGYAGGVLIDHVTGDKFYKDRSKRLVD